MSMKSFLHEGDVYRSEFPTQNQLPLYIGSGTAGGCIDGYGLMHQDFFDDAFHSRSLHYRTWRHFYRGDHEVDQLVGLYHLEFESKPTVKKEGYSQSLSLFEATVNTEYVTESNTCIRIRAFCHPKYPDILSFVYEYDGNAPALMLVPEAEVAGHYGLHFTVKNDLCANGFTSYTNACQTNVRINILTEIGEHTIRPCDDRLRLRFSNGKGRHLILILTGDDKNEAREVAEEISSIDAWIASAQAAWEQTFGSSYVSLPDKFLSAMAARSLYYILSSFSDLPSPPSPPMGYTGYGWPFHFPQDISFIHPVLLRLGKIEHAKRIVEHYRETLEKLERITHRIYGGNGVMWAWIYPMGDGEDYLNDGAPNPCYYEIHNAAYPARMAYETALQAKNEEWTRNIALPIIRSSAEFYASHLKRSSSGTWDLHVVPSMSQDEFAGVNLPNYLCALYSARYCFEIASRVGISDYAQYLEDGLSFAPLFDPTRNLYRTSEQMKEETWGLEKHPVQLNPLIFLPFAANDTELNAYVRRADICEATKNNFIHGWTLAAFCLAAAHVKDSEGLEKELSRGALSDYHDVESLSFYETSQASTMPYYVTTHGFWLQALLDAFVNDFFGETAIESAIPPQWKGAEYHNLYTKDGVPHSGTV